MNGNIFTIEFWLYKTALFSSNYETVFGQATGISGGNPYGWAFGRFSTTSSAEVGLRCGSSWSIGIPYAKITTNTWHHIAISRKIDKGYVFLDGALITEKDMSSSTTTYTLNFGHTDFAIGSLYWSGSYYFKGYLDEFRISDVCRYTTDFTPPTEPFTI